MLYLGNQLDQAYKQVTRLVKEMAQEPQPIPRLISRRMRATTLLAMGRPAEALEDLETAYALYQSAQISDFSAKFAQDPGVQIWSYMLLAKWLCGDQKGAQDIGDRAITRARELKHANTMCYAGLHDVTMSIWAGNIERARSVNNEMRQVANDHDMALWKLFVGIHDAVIDCMADEAGAPTRLDAALVEYSANGCRLWITLYLAEKAKALLRAGDTEGAEATIRRAFVEQEATGEHWAEAELNRISGEICLFRGDAVAAEQAFETAISVARFQKALSLEERAMQSRDQRQTS